ncbi:MAG TPA: gamma-glutamyl-gamma-aminobutyrate hydrolase family protein, partial [Pseudonocardiaceae bacterium]|nr:gamma-glutamyl-gamma-aminobutyrate hydrolase family protein [Pseudonocardiaceae bacterium]
MASSASKPVIGLTTYLEPAKFLVWETEAALLHRVYVDCVVAAGG